MRIVTAPETVSSGFAGRKGEVWGESVRPRSEVSPVIGERGEGIALSVFFEDTEEHAWFAPHLVESFDSPASRRSLAAVAAVAALTVTAATALAVVARSSVHSLTLVDAATPCLPVQGYLTAGSYPNVLGSSTWATTTNLALRRAVLSDERRYAWSVRRHTIPTVAGVYQTAIDRRLISASSVVVSALLPARRVAPDGTAARTWISTTIDVRSGRPVPLHAILANAPLALPVLAQDWEASLRHSPLWPQLVDHPEGYTPTPSHYQYFALTRTGLAFGFPQGRAGSRIAAIIPYRLVRPYLSPLGRRLAAGARRPKLAPSRHAGLTWASLQKPGVARSWPLACT